MLTEQVAEAPVPANVQVPPGVKVTVPVGAVGAALVSVTVAVQLVAWLMATVEGVQATVVVVAWAVTPEDTATVWLLLALPPTLSVTVKVTV
jgi:hypothetical protein